MIDTALRTPRKFVPKGTAAEVIAILLNVSYALKIDAETVVKIFRKEEPVDKWEVLLDEFFADCPVPFIKDFMAENGFTSDDLKYVQMFRHFLTFSFKN
ncbi:MAG: hypothetical protein LBT23_03060, partial [Synergistaceae bacterium]|nr:hypothetical protein [Synergistaceae bacterium]